jgi:hypothetical protein
LPQYRAVGQLGRTSHCLEPTVHSGRSGEAFPLRGRRGACYQRGAAVRPLTEGSLLTTGAQTQPPPPVTPLLDDARRIRHLMFYFGMVFVVEGIGQTDGIIAQPLIYYSKEVHSGTPVQVTAALTAFNLPWIIKPI